ncbi:MAG: HDIG domain-containing protein, partial [Caldithrix sp.]|nr:HDIG domain-containing protein [Caldithrix sp.]
NQTIALNYLIRRILQPNLLYQKEMTEEAVQQARSSVSLTKDLVVEDERIVDANERIDEEIYQKLYSLEVAKVERSKRESNWQLEFAFMGKMMMVAAILLIVGLYLYSYRRKIFDDNYKLLMITIILLIEFAAAAIMNGPLDWPVYVIPTTIGSMLFAILIDSGIAFVGTVVIALILGGIQGGGYDISFITLVSGMVAIYSVHEIRNRNHVLKPIVLISLAYFWISIAIAAIRYDSLSSALSTFSYTMLPNAVLSPVLTFMILGVFEKFFDVTTDITLLELSDLNHPLLKRLSLEAPGSFHHSMIVGNLAESAAKAIYANPLLARVGSYYHDIGKIEKPEYFVENQVQHVNRHDGLSPRMSALILSAHVKNGVEMAKRYSIPKKIRDFIPEHHGTNIMTYFHNKALSKNDGKEVNESDFRYPGPKPQSKETGIVMLADAVEAATRTIKNPTPKKVRTFVENLVDSRFKDGELDECDLTLRDLKKIIDAFMTVLTGVFQQRIEYPDMDKKKEKEKEKETNKSKPVNTVDNGHSNTST